MISAYSSYKKCLVLLVLVLLIFHSIFRNTLLWFQEDVVPSLQDHFLPLEYGRKIVARQPFVSNRYVCQRATFFLFVMWTGIYFSLNPQEYPFFNFAMILLEPYLNVSSNFLINCLLCFTQKRLRCYAVSKNWAFFISNWSM